MPEITIRHLSPFVTLALCVIGSMLLITNRGFPSAQVDECCDSEEGRAKRYHLCY